MLSNQGDVKMTYDQLYAECSPLLEHYRTDLTEHDKRDISARPGVPFLHWTHDSGTTIVFLAPIDDSEYPAYGVRVPYLFGAAGREHILDQKVIMAEYHTRPSNGPHRYTCHHFDGKRLKLVSVEKAVEIAKAYARPIQGVWHTEWLKHNRPWEFKALRDAVSA